MDSPLPLVPDDADQQENLTLTGKQAAPAQPYALTALMVAMGLLLAQRGLLPHSPWWAHYGMAVAVGLLVYLLLSGPSASLPLVFLTILAAELGLLYSLPTNRLFLPAHADFSVVANLLVDMLGACLAGIIFAHLLRVEHAPNSVLTFTFLFMFVGVNLWFLFFR